MLGLPPGTSMRHNGAMHTPEEERQAIRAAQEVERTWWESTQPYATTADLTQSLERGELVPIVDSESFRVSENIPKQFHTLTPNGAFLLREISSTWRARMVEKKLRTEETFLVISSLTRPSDYQNELREKGFPTADESSHERGVAFDIGAAWFREHYPEALETLFEVLGAFQTKGYINYIDEPTVGVVHVAMSPTYPAN